MKTTVTRFHVIVTVVAGTLLAACHSNPSAPATHSGTGPHWSYEGETGPSHWGSLAPEFALCATGKKQSPVNIADVVPKDLANIEFHYESTPVEIINNGHAIQVNYVPGSHILLDGERFDLLQFHFHSPSEHHIKGRAYSAEMHLVHKSASGGLAVLGVLIDQGAYNAKFEPVWKNLPAEPGPAQRINAVINVADLLPNDPRTYRYDGSLTTPPGTEGVRWCLMTELVTLSPEQIADFRKIIHGNNRPVQAHNGRVILQDQSR